MTGSNQHQELRETLLQVLSDADAGREFDYSGACDAVDSLFEQLETLREAAQAFVSAHDMQKRWGEDYEWPGDEYVALREALNPASRPEEFFGTEMSVGYPDP